MKVVQTEVMAEATCWETMEDSEDRERSARATLEEETTSKINKIFFSARSVAASLHRVPIPNKKKIKKNGRAAPPHQ